jgi:hypothetical protein
MSEGAAITLAVSRQDKNLHVKANAAMQKYLDDAKNWNEWESDTFMRDVLDPFISQYRFEWIAAWEIGALTDAPILGTRNARGKITNAWGYMDYQVKSILDDLANWGEAVLQRG